MKTSIVFSLISLITLINTSAKCTYFGDIEEFDIGKKLMMRKTRCNEISRQ